MPHVYNRCVSSVWLVTSVWLVICLLAFAFFGHMPAGAQEPATPDPNRSRTPALPSGLMDIDQTDREAMRKHLEQYNALRVERDRVTEEALNEVFPPEKFKRLKQIALQMQIQEAGMDNVLIHGVLGEAIHLSEVQRETLASQADEYEAEKQARIRKIMAYGRDTARGCLIGESLG